MGCCHERFHPLFLKEWNEEEEMKVAEEDRIGTEEKNGRWSSAPRLFIQGEQFHVQGPVFNAKTVLKGQSRCSDLKGIWIRQIATVREKCTVFWRWRRGGRRNSKLKIAKILVKNSWKATVKSGELNSWLFQTQTLVN